MTTIVTFVVFVLIPVCDPLLRKHMDLYATFQLRLHPSPQLLKNSPHRVLPQPPPAGE